MRRGARSHTMDAVISQFSRMKGLSNLGCGASFTETWRALDAMLQLKPLLQEEELQRFQKDVLPNVLAVVSCKEPNPFFGTRKPHYIYMHDDAHFVRHFFCGSFQPW